MVTDENLPSSSIHEINLLLLNEFVMFSEGNTYFMPKVQSSDFFFSRRIGLYFFFVVVVTSLLSLK